MGDQRAGQTTIVGIAGLVLLCLGADFPAGAALAEIK